MKSFDLNARENAREAMTQALRNDDKEAYAAAFEQMVNAVAEEVRAEVEQSADEKRQKEDSAVLAIRGVRQLTSEEKTFYQRLSECVEAKNPKQALENMNLAFPETVINAVFEDLRDRHPLLSEIDFIPTGAAIRMIMNANGTDRAVWGELCDEIVKEAAGGIKVVNATLYKLSAFLFVCKQMFVLGPAWIDRFVREVLSEYFANGLEYGLVTGTGKDEPIGMDRQVGEGVVVVGGVYPQKELVTISNFDIATIGNLISLLAVDDFGKQRNISNLILVVNPVDYYAKVVPATMIMAPDGTWRSTLPYPIKIVPSSAVALGEAVFGLAKRYFAAAGASKEGNIEYSDHYRFVEDQRTYIIKGFANGMPKDNKAFIRLDIKNLKAPAYKVINVTPEPSDDATLTSLKIGALTLTPTFAPDETTYTAETTNATNTVTAIATDAGATVKVELNNVEIVNGSAATWAEGSNTVKVTVTAEDGTTTGAYTVTVTKS